MTSEKTLTREIAEFIVAQDFESIPPEVITMAKRCVIDSAAVMLAGSTTDCGSIIREYIGAVGGKGEASVLGSRLKAQAHLATLANATSGHAMDYDDTQLSTTPDRVYGLLTHPTVPVLAASMAVGQETHAGREFLTAFCTGFEVECKVAEAIDPRHYQQGFHSTGTVGIFGSAAAAARLMELSLEQTRYALGIAASKSAGIRANFGTMTKPYHSGAAAENGIVAARLAGLGYQSAPDALDGQWGFFQVTGGGCEPERIQGKLGNPWSILEPGVSIKPYPCGSLAHPSMDGLLDLLVENDIRAEDIQEIALGTNSSVLAPLRYQDPQDHLEAKFSFQFCLGILALERKAGIQQFRDEVVHREDVRQMMGRVRTYLHEGIEAKGFDLIRSLVEVKLKDGRVFSREADTSRGTPQRPMSQGELGDKFRECATGVLSDQKMEKALEAIEGLDEIGDVNEFVGKLL